MKLLLRIVVLAMALWLSVGLARTGMAAAQSPAAGPKPGAETQRLGYFVGKWSGEVEIKPTQFGPGGQFTESADSSWMPGGFFIVMHWLEKMPTAQGRTLMVLGYDAIEKVYTFHTFQGTGEAAAAKGALDGDTWTFYGESPMGGKPMKSRFSMKELSPNSCRTRLEVSSDGTTWIIVMEGKITKAM
jgi:hypothetical protein